MRIARALVLVATTLLAFACDDDDPANTAPNSAGADARAEPPKDAGGTETPSPADAAARPDGGVMPGTAACSPRDPNTYPNENFDVTVAAELALRTRLAAVNGPMAAAEMDLMMKPTPDSLKMAFAAGMPSLRSVTTAYYAARIEALFDSFAASAGMMWMPASPPPATGGKFASWIFDKNGVDLRQSVEKGVFGAAFYNHALGLMKGPVTAETVDRLVAAFGAHASFPMSDNAMTPNRDVQAAQYAKRRTNPMAGTPGMYPRIKSTLIAARVAAMGGAACKTELDRALKSFREQWEKVLFATVIYYANNARTSLAKDAATAMDIGSALHGLGEGMSFAHGFKGLPADGRIVTDAQIDELLALFNAPAQGEASVYKFATDTAAEVGKLGKIIDKVQMIYGFTAAEVEGFKSSY
jgi:hypothetical protein